MAEKITRVLFALFLLLFPFAEIGRFDLGGNVALRIIDILAGFLFVIWLITKGKNNLFQKALAKPILFFVGALIVSLFVNIQNYQQSEIIVASFYLLRWIAYAGLYFIISDFDTKFKSKITQLLVMAGAVIVGLGYIQYFFYPNLRNLYYAGWDEHLYRMFSTFLDPNFAGTFFVLYLIFLCGLFWSAYKKKEYGKVQIYGGILVLTFCAILLTFSRSAFIMLAVAMTVFLIQIKKTRLLLGVVVISVIFLGLISRSLQSEGTNLFRTASNAARLESAKRATTIFLDNPVFGVGFNAYRYAQPKYGFTTKSKYEDHAGAGTDNSFLFVLVTTGVVGFLAYLYLWYAIITRQVPKQVRHDKDWLNMVFFCSMLGLLVNAFFINSLFYPFIMAWVWILAGITDRT